MNGAINGSIGLFGYSGVFCTASGMVKGCFTIFIGLDITMDAEILVIIESLKFVKLFS